MACQPPKSPQITPNHPKSPQITAVATASNCRVTAVALPWCLWCRVYRLPWPAIPCHGRSMPLPCHARSLNRWQCPGACRGNMRGTEVALRGTKRNRHPAPKAQALQSHQRQRDGHAMGPHCILNPAQSPGNWAFQAPMWHVMWHRWPLPVDLWRLRGPRGVLRGLILDLGGSHFYPKTFLVHPKWPLQGNLRGHRGTRRMSTT
jgi:hypothetical protein